jgi:hypothetical protein
VNTSWKSPDRKQVIWPVVGIVIGALARTNPFYEPHITLEVGVTAWFVDMVLVLIMSCHPFTARVGVLVAGLFMAVPCFLRALPVFRFLLMCGMGFAFAVAAVQLFAVPTAGFRGRLAYLFTWLGTREVKRRARSFDAVSLLHLIVATLVLAAAVAVVKAVSPSGIWWLARWLAGGIMLLACAEMTTAGHYFLTALMGLNAPALMRSPHRSASIGEFWAKRWNPAASALVFGKYFFAPLARREVGLALFAAFFASAVAHVLLLYMATQRWGISLMWGAFFLVQPLFIAVERRMKVRRWRPMAKWAWTLAALAIASPLLVEPALQLIEPTWGTPDKVLLPTIRVLGLVIFVNVFVSLGSLASIRELTPPNKVTGANAGGPRELPTRTRRAARVAQFRR